MKLTDKIKVLAVDDNADNRFVFEQVFSDIDDIEIKTVSSGEDAISILPEYKPDVVLIDVFMPDMDGFEATKKIVEKDAALPVILFSAKNPTREEILRGLRSGASDFFDKPSSDYHIVIERCKELGDIKKIISLTENALKDSEERFIFTLKGSKTTAFNQDTELKYTWIYNPASGLTADEIIGKTDKDILPSDDAKVLMDIKRRVLNIGIKEEHIVPFTVKGQTLYYDIAIEPIRDNNDRIIGIKGTSTDVTEIKKAEEALGFTQFAVDHMGDAAYWMGPDAKIIYVNDASCRALGFSHEELLSMTVHDLDPEFPKSVWPSHWEDLRKRKTFTFETTHLKKDGRIFPVEITVNYVRFGDKEYNCAFAKDITERKKAEDALRENEEKYRILFERESDAIFIYDPDTTNILDANIATSKMYGYDKNELVDMSCLKFSAEVEKSASTIERIRENNEVTVPHRIHRKKDGTIFPVDVSGYTMTLGGKNMMFAVIKDITERKLAEDALMESEKKYKTLFEQSTDAILIIDGDKFVDCNLSTVKMLGYANKKEFLETHPSQLSPETQPDGKNSFEKANEMMSIAIDQGSHRFEWDHKRQNGEVFPVEVLLTAIPFGDRDCLHVVWRDISERKHLEEQLQIRQRMDSLGTLAGGIAHDFNNILVGIMGNIDMLKMNNENFTEYQKEYLRNAEQSSIRAANLIRQFQTLSSGAVRGTSTVDIYDISIEVFSLLKETTDRLIDKQIKFKKGEFFVTVDSGELHQALLNLATNAAQAIEVRGARHEDYIRIIAEDYMAVPGDRTGLQEGDYIHISFEDSGVGMSDEILKKAFDPLFTTKGLGVKKGQGLGLAMVYNIVTRIYKGHIYIESEEGKGTTFHIFLPRTEPGTAAEQKATIEMKGGAETILIVDDEETIRNLTFKLLTQIGYTVITAGDGKEAIKVFKKQMDTIDVVILDLTMPQMSGKQVFQKMLDINPDVKIIISSGHGEEYSREGILANAKGNVKKPYKLIDMTEIVRNVLDL